MARMISGTGTPSMQHASLRLLLRRPTLQQPPRQDITLGLCSSLGFVKPVVGVQQLQTRVFSHYLDYYRNIQPKNSKPRPWPPGGEESKNTNKAHNNLLDAAMLPICEDLRGLDHGTRSRLVEASLLVIWHLLHTAPGESIGATLRQEISSDKEKVKGIMEKVRDTSKTGEKRRQLAEDILAQLHALK